MQESKIKYDFSFTSELRAGWNLGNSFDVFDVPFQTQNPYDFETFWDNPRVTEDLIVKIKKSGFQAIRIPITWYPHMDKDYKVNGDWMKRIQEVVDYCIENGLRVIINAHHENWYDPADNNMKQALVIMEILWTQIGQYFADYGEYLAFEGMNEPRLRDTPYEWSPGTEKARKNINVLNQKFISTIRTLGGNNASRFLLVPTYCAVISKETFQELVLPPDDRVMVSVHMYQPFSFTHNNSTVPNWNPGNLVDTDPVDRAMADLNQYLVKKGIPVIISEFGAIDKQNEIDRINWTQYVEKKAAKLKIPCFWWDNGGKKDAWSREFSLINRYTGEWLFPGIVEAITTIFPGGK